MSIEALKELIEEENFHEIRNGTIIIYGDNLTSEEIDSLTKISFEYTYLKSKMGNRIDFNKFLEYEFSLPPDYHQGNRTIH